MKNKLRVWSVTAAVLLLFTILSGALFAVKTVSYVNGSDVEATVLEVDSYTKSRNKRTYTVQYELNGQMMESSFTERTPAAKYSVGDTVTLRIDTDSTGRVIMGSELTAAVFLTMGLAAAAVIAVIEAVRIKKEYARKFG